MLIAGNSILYSYVITRDFGFAPNPFHSYCSLATCKPRIRKAANVGDWVMGVGGSSLGSAKKKCIFLMKVSEKLTFEEYWADVRFNFKKPVRNGSRVQMLGDNIYHRNENGEWVQEDSHHSNPDGSPNHENLQRDTGSSESVLISDCFYYFGSAAIDVDLVSIGFERIRDFKKTNISQSPGALELITSISKSHKSTKNIVISDPLQFMHSHMRADQISGKVV